MIGRYSGKTWSDAKAPIESKLGEIVAKLESDAQKIKAEKLIRQEEQRIREERERIIREQQEEQQRIIREHQQRIEKEKSDFKDLYQQAKRWKQAKLIREYLIAFEQDATEKGGLTDKVRNWIKWANDKTDWFDPFIKKEDAILGYFQ